jgi:hypothetical protein
MCLYQGLMRGDVGYGRRFATCTASMNPNDDSDRLHEATQLTNFSEL